MMMKKNEYGEEIKYDGEWFYHSDIGKIKLVYAVSGIMCVNDEGNSQILNEMEYLLMLKMKLEGEETL